MSAPYDTPTNISNMTSFLTYVNGVSDGWFASVLCIAIFFISFISLKIYSASKAFSAASFITFISILIFIIMGLVNNLILILGVLMLIAGIVWLQADESRDY